MGKELKNDFNNNFDFNRSVDVADWNEKVHSRLFIQNLTLFQLIISLLKVNYQEKIVI